MKAIATATLIAFALLLAGCNTMRGLGQDVQKVGDKIEEKARK
jgi:predicted small secreted protein